MTELLEFKHLLSCWIMCRHNTGSLLCRWWWRHSAVCTSALQQAAAAAACWLERSTLQTGRRTGDVRSVHHRWPCVSSVIGDSSSRITAATRQWWQWQDDDHVRTGQRGNCTPSRRRSTQRVSAQSQLFRQN